MHLWKKATDKVNGFNIIPLELNGFIPAVFSEYIFY
jgi:hypothetical protein